MRNGRPFFGVLDQSGLLHQQETILQIINQLEIRLFIVLSEDNILIIDRFSYGAIFRISESLWTTEESFLGQSYATFVIELVTLFYQRFTGRLYLQVRN